MLLIKSEGVGRVFVKRVWKLKSKIPQNQILNTNSKSLILKESLIHQTIKKVTEDIESMKMNTAVSSLMILTNYLEKEKSVSQNDYFILLKLLAPFAPHMTEELWSLFGHEDSIHTQVWPTYDPNKLVSDEVTLAVQINGKIRAMLVVPTSATEEEITAKTLALREVEKWLDGNKPHKVIIVPGKIVSIVV